MDTPVNIVTELNELQSSLAGTYPAGPAYGVPAGYFSSLAETMLTKVRALEVQEEINAAAPALAGITKANPFRIPAGYFKELDPMAGIREEEVSPLLAGLRNKPAFTVPENYFSGLAVNAEQDELASLSPLLDKLSRNTPYTLPEGYFDQLNPMAVVNKQPAKVISMGSFNWKRSVAAAAVALIISVSAVFYFDRDKSSSDVNGAVAAQTGPAPTDSNTSGTGDVYAVNAADAAEIHQLVKNVPDQAIQEFLNETGGEETVIDDALLN